MSSPSHYFSYRHLSVLICLQTPVSLSSCFLHFILCCPSPYCIPHPIIKCRTTILISYFPCLAARFFHVKTARFVRWHHSLPTFGSEIALSARMSAPSFAGSPRCAFTMTKKVAVPAAILFRSISMAATRISASGDPTNVAFPPSPIHLVTAFNNDSLSHKYSNGSSISVSRSARKNAANSGRFDLEPSSSRPTHLCRREPSRF